MFVLSLSWYHIMIMLSIKLHKRSFVHVPHPRLTGRRFSSHRTAKAATAPGYHLYKNALLSVSFTCTQRLSRACLGKWPRYIFVSEPSVTEKRFVLSHAPAMIPAAEAVYLNLASGVPCVLKPIWSTASLRKSKKRKFASPPRFRSSFLCMLLPSLSWQLDRFKSQMKPIQR